MGKQVRVNLTIDAKVVEKAKELGLNLSKVSENALKEMIRRLEGSNQQSELKIKLLSSKKLVVGPLGFEPRVSGSASQCHNPY